MKSFSNNLIHFFKIYLKIFCIILMQLFIYSFYLYYLFIYYAKLCKFLCSYDNFFNIFIPFKSIQNFYRISLLSENVSVKNF